LELETAFLYYPYKLCGLFPAHREEAVLILLRLTPL
jgi:hypothetical protein